MNRNLGYVQHFIRCLKISEIKLYKNIIIIWQYSFSVVDMCIPQIFINCKFFKITGGFFQTIPGSKNYGIAG